jgi:OST-HTH/LOTUS domain
VLTALEQSIDDAGWAHLGTFGAYLTKLQPEFDSRLYGYKKLSDLVKAMTDLFVTEERQTPGSNQRVLYLRAK